MSDGVIITLIICITLLGMTAISAFRKNKEDK